MNIILIGMRGTGKTTVGELVAANLLREFYETDQMIQEREKATTQEIIANKGWKHFRDLESEIVREIASQRNAVIATGGGVILRSDNAETLSKNGALYLLTATTETMLRRIGDDENRPSLTGKISRRDDITETWQQRERLYLDAADETIATETLTKAEVAEAIIKRHKEKYAN